MFKILHYQRRLCRPFWIGTCNEPLCHWQEATTAVAVSINTTVYPVLFLLYTFARISHHQINMPTVTVAPIEIPEHKALRGEGSDV
jgi:hypothetical protein